MLHVYVACICCMYVRYLWNRCFSLAKEGGAWQVPPCSTAHMQERVSYCASLGSSMGELLGGRVHQDWAGPTKLIYA